MSAVTRAYAEVDGRQLHYRLAGEAGAPWLLLLHQAPSTSAMYLPLMSALAPRYRMLAPDLPGFGGSDALPGGADIAGFAAAIITLLDVLGIERCRVFGHHTGAAVAVQLAAEQPGRCDALALCGPPLLTAAQRASLPAQVEPFPVTADGSHLRKWWQRFQAKEQDAPPALIQRELLSALSAGDTYQGTYRAVCVQDFAAQLPRISCPVLVLAGDADPLHGAVADTLALLPQGRQGVLPTGAGTYACERHTPALAAQLSEFFDNEPMAMSAGKG